MPRRTIIAIDPPFVWRILVGISVILIALDVSLQTLDWIAEPAVPGWETIVIILDADGESSIPTWWGSLLLTTAAITSALVAHTSRHTHPRDHLYLWAFAAIFILLSIDEQAMIHEHAIVPLRERFGFGGPLFFAWVVPAALGVAILIAVCIRFVFRQPLRVRRLLILAAVLYLSGALVLEMFGGWWSESRGPNNLAYQSITSVEELLEFLGASTYVLAMMHLLRDRRNSVELTFTSSNPSG